MTNDEDWVADVRRWVAASSASNGASAREESDEVGYEAAHPSLQAPYWPDASRFGLDSSF